MFGLSSRQSIKFIVDDSNIAPDNKSNIQTMTTTQLKYLGTRLKASWVSYSNKCPFVATPFSQHT